jgi:hypothetical protein
MQRPLNAEHLEALTSQQLMALAAELDLDAMSDEEIEVLETAMQRRAARDAAHAEELRLYVETRQFPNEAPPSDSTP